MTSFPIALIGTGYVAPFYADSLANYPGVSVVGAFDIDTNRCQRFTHAYPMRTYRSLGELLDDDAVMSVLNLTPADDHAAVSRQALDAGKHVYSEKPAALKVADARSLAEYARRRSLVFSSAPSILFAPNVRAAVRGVRRGLVGRPLAIYANMDDGAVHQMAHSAWIRPHGVPWPAAGEFTSGCVLQHAGYALSVVHAICGPTTALTFCTRVLVPDKLPGLPPADMGPDFSCGLLSHASGAVTRLTCSTVGTRDRSLTVFGDAGVLRVEDVWRANSAVTVQPARRATADAPEAYLADARVVPPVGAAHALRGDASHSMDFALGVLEHVAAVRAGTPSVLADDFLIHLTDVTMAMDRRDVTTVAPITSGFDDAVWYSQYEAAADVIAAWGTADKSSIQPTV